ncbi:MAG: hypothetical protein ACRDJ9_30245, partial [Dehalococcoidia bacterium]
YSLSGDHGGLHSGSRNARGYLGLVRRHGRVAGYETTAVSGLGDEGFEQVGLREFPNGAHPTRRVEVVVRVHNVAIQVEYYSNDGDDLDEMRRTVRGITAAAVQRLQAVNPDR